MSSMRRPALSVLLTSVLSAAATLAVVAHAWVSDDAMITMRYATNLVHGYGPVFNDGERVQGFTHPLWFLLVTLVVVFEDNPLVVSIALGAFLTVLTVAVLVWTILCRTRDSLAGGALAVSIVLLSLQASPGSPFRPAASKTPSPSSSSSCSSSRSAAPAGRGSSARPC